MVDFLEFLEGERRWRAIQEVRKRAEVQLVRFVAAREKTTVLKPAGVEAVRENMLPSTLWAKQPEREFRKQKKKLWKLI